MAKELSDQEPAKKRVKAITARKQCLQLMTKDEKEHLLSIAESCSPQAKGCGGDSSLTTCPQNWARIGKAAEEPKDLPDWPTRFYKFAATGATAGGPKDFGVTKGMLLYF